MAEQNPSPSNAPAVENLLGEELSAIKIPPRPAALAHIGVLRLQEDDLPALLEAARAQRVHTQPVI